MHSPRNRPRGGRVPYVPASSPPPVSPPDPTAAAAVAATSTQAQAVSAPAPAASAHAAHTRFTVHPPPSQPRAQVAPAAAEGSPFTASPPFELFPSSTTDKEPQRGSSESASSFAFAADPLPVAAAAAASSSSSDALPIDKLTTVSSTVQPRFDPSSPVAVSNRPLPRVLHRATSIKAASAQAPDDPASPANATSAYKKPTPITSVQAAVAHRASMSHQMATPPQLAARMLSVQHSSSPPPPLLVPTLSQMDGDAPPTAHRSQSVGSSTYELEPGAPSDLAPANDLALTRAQSDQRAVVPPIILTTLTPSPSSSADEPQLSPSPQSATSSQKRAHASWSLPARRESGASGFNSSSFRPHLQKDLYASGGGSSPSDCGPRRSLSGQPPGRLSLVSENSGIEMHDLSIMIAPPTPVNGAPQQPAAASAAAAGSSPLLPPSRSPSSAGGSNAARPYFPRTVVGGLTSAAAAGSVAAKGTSMLRQSPRQLSIEEARLKAAGGHSHGVNSAARSNSPPVAAAASRNGGGGGRRRGGGGCGAGRCCRSFLVCLNSFPTRIPFSKRVALALFHPLWLLVSLLLTLVAVFALDFTLAFLDKSFDAPCDYLLLAIGALWSLELVLCSLTLPGFLLMSAWWWVDALAIVSLAADIAPLDGLTLGKSAAYATYFAAQPSTREASGGGGGSFDGLAGGRASAQVWLCLHYLRMVRLCKFWNGIQAFSGALSAEALYARIEAAYGRKRATSACADSSVSSPKHRNSPFHKASTLGLHLTNRMQKKIAGCFVGLIVLFSLCLPAAHSVVHVPNSCAMDYTELPSAAASSAAGALSLGGSGGTIGSGNVLQWTIGLLDGLYASAVYSAAPERTLSPASDPQLRVEQHADYQTMQRVSADFASSFGESSSGASGSILSLAVGAPRFNYSTAASAGFVAASVELVRRDDAELDRLRTMETVTFRCGRSALTISQSPFVHARACWNLLLLSSLWLLYLLLMSFIGYDLNTLISHPLERMNRSIRKMAGTVLFLASAEEAEIAAEDSTDDDDDDGERSGGSGPSGTRKSKLTASSSSWFLNNLGQSHGRKAGGSLPSCLSSEAARNARWTAPSILPLHCEFDRLEEVLSKMSSVFNLLPGGLGSLFGFPASGGGGGGKGGDESKARRMMVGSRRTEIKTRDSILTIDVVERPINNPPSTSPRRAAGSSNLPSEMAELKLHGHRRDAAHSSAPPTSAHGDEFISSSTLLAPAGSTNGHAPRAGAHAHPPSSPSLVPVNPAGRASFLNVSHGSSSAASSPVLGASHSPPVAALSSLHPELRSLESLLLDPFASLYFKQYLHRKFCLETWSFYDQVQQYRSRMQSWAFRIFHQFVVAGAPHEINIQSAQRQAISEGIFHPTLDLFDKAQRETYKLMKTNFVDFLASHAALSYVAAKERKRLTINVREEQI